MKKTIIVAIIAGVIVLGVVVAALVFRPLPPATPPATPPQTTDNVEQSAMVPAAGRYEPYDAASIDDEGYDETILFFHAGWCPECRAFEKAIQSSAMPDGIQILKIDYDNAQELREKYGITLQSTFVKVADDGEEISQWVGYGKDKSVDAILENT